MLARLVRPSQFAQVLGTPPCSRTAHFSAHYAEDVPPRTQRPTSAPPETELSTIYSEYPEQAVDRSLANGAATGPALGLVVPKRHAKRAVTRNLIKRHMRAVAEARAPLLGRGAWVLRLRAGFDGATYAAARSDALADAVRGELVVLLDRAVLKVRR